MRLNIARRGSPLWHACAELARDSYRRQYGARIQPDPDGFVVLVGDDDTAAPVACAGMTYGGGRLLIENYFPDTALGEVVAARVGTVIDPNGLFEVGPFASRETGAGLSLLKMLPALLWCNGAQVALCTATRSLALAFERVGIDFHPLVTATESVLPEDQRGRWGTYYETRPLAGYVDLRGIAAQISHGGGGQGYGLAVSWARESDASGREVRA